MDEPEVLVKCRGCGYKGYMKTYWSVFRGDCPNCGKGAPFKVVEEEQDKLYMMKQIECMECGGRTSLRLKIVKEKTNLVCNRCGKYTTHKEVDSDG